MAERSTNPCFDGIVGHNVPVRVLSHLVDLSRLPGTLLFSGPSGVGKLATAISLAKRLHCRNAGTDFCDCDSCRAIRLGNHPDVIVLSRDRLIGVEEMRDLVALAGLRSASGHERVIIIDRAENITQAAANAALKTLEEPGDRVRFVLVCDTPASLLSTVRSRSYRVRFSLVPKEAMEEFATRIGDKPDDAETRASIDFATGRPGWYLRYRHIDGYGDLVKDIGEWIDELVEFRGKVTLESALEWKKSFKHKASDKDKKGGKDGDGWAERLVAKEREAQLPRGADAFEIARWLSDRSKFTVSPINWRVDQHADREGRWGEGRTILLLAGLMRHVISLQDRAAKADVLVRLQDFTQKIRWNCSFDIALERLYFALAGLVS